MKNKEQNIRLLQNLVWENYFRHEGDQPEVWRNRHCTRMSEIMMQKKPDERLGWQDGAEGDKILLAQKKTNTPPKPRTLYNFSRMNDVSDNTLSFLVDSIYSDNADFITFWKEKYFSEFEKLWDAFQDYSNQQIQFQDEDEKNCHSESFEPRQINFPDPLLQISKWFKGNTLFLFLFFFVIYDVVIIALSWLTHSWTGIDYPLSNSYTVWIGYVFFAAAATVFSLFNQKFSCLLNFVGYSGESILHRFSVQRNKVLFLMLAVLVSGGLHYTFLSDDIHGWCETAPGSISILGVYHILLYAFNLWIVFLFIFYLMHIGSVIKAIGEASGNSKSDRLNFTKELLPVFSALNTYYKILSLCFGGFSILFIITTVQFFKDSKIDTPFFWHWVEIGILVILYVVFGFILYWQFFVPHISNFLISERNKQLLHSSLNKHEVLSAITLPVTPDEINKPTSGYLTILIWLISIIILLLIGALLL